MKSILEDFARGNISPDTRGFKRDSHFGRTMNILADSESKLYSLLNEEATEILKQFSDAQAEISLLTSIDRFVYGYRLGVLMTMEVFNGQDDVITAGEEN